MKKAVIVVSILILVYFMFVSNDNHKNKPSNVINKRSVVNKSIHKGIAMTLYDSTNNDQWFDETFPKIKNMGAELQVVTGVHVKDLKDSVPVNDPNVDEKLNRLFKKSKEYGVKISMLKPHLMSPELGDSFDRGSYMPADINLFFSQWKNIILYYAKVSEENHVSFLSITCETTALTQNTYVPYWQEIINEVREKYPAVKITMAFKKEELDRELAYHEKKLISVSPFLDEISLNMYPKVKREYVHKKRIFPTDDIFVINSEQYGFIEGIRKAHRYFKKDILITETGSTYRSDSSKDYLNPIVLDTTKPHDYIDQQYWLQIVVSVLLQMKEIKGIYVWNVNSPFQILDAPSAKVLKKLYRE
mgnify:CR=1 FL=1